MPAPSPVKGGKLPKKARIKAIILYADQGLCDRDDCAREFTDDQGERIFTIPVAILPCASKAQAARICRVHNMTHEERLNLATDALLQVDPVTSRKICAFYAEAVLNALGLDGEAKR